MKVFWSLVERDIKLFFKDRTFFLVAMVSPMILLLLFVTFLKSIYVGTFEEIFNSFGAVIDAGLTDGAVTVYLFASLLSVSCVTVAFCCNVMSIQDKIHGVENDFKVTPVSRTIVAFSYLMATFLVSVLICLIMFALLMIIALCMGQFYFDATSIIGGIGNIILLSLFGSILSSIVCYFCSTEAQVNVITATVSSCYGFLCGAYMPISQFSNEIGNFISMLPGTYGTSLLKNHLLSGYLAKMQDGGLPIEAAEAIREGFDLKLTLFGNEISTNVMWIVMIAAIVILSIIFAIISLKRKNRRT